MTPSQLMQALADAGAPMEAIVIALRALEEKDAEIAARDAVTIEKRAKDAERKRLARVHGHSTDIPETVTGQGADPALSRPPNEINSNPPTHTHPVCESPRVRKAHRLPVDWQPRPLPEPLASAVNAWPAGAIEREMAKFRDWAASAPGKTGLKSDWDAAWRNWLRRRDEEGTYTNVRTLRPAEDFAGLRGSRPNSALDMVLQSERELAAEAIRENPGTDWTPRAALPSG